MSNQLPSSSRDERLAELVRQTGRHMALYQVLWRATTLLDRGEEGQLMAMWQDGGLAIYRFIVNQDDPLPCPGAFVEDLEKGFLEGFDAASVVVREALR